MSPSSKPLKHPASNAYSQVSKIQNYQHATLAVSWAPPQESLAPYKPWRPSNSSAESQSNSKAKCSYSISSNPNSAPSTLPSAPTVLAKTRPHENHYDNEN